MREDKEEKEEERMWVKSIQQLAITNDFRPNRERPLTVSKGYTTLSS